MLSSYKIRIGFNGEKMIDCIKKEQCTGCKMCADICPQGAIYFETDEQGFWYPKVSNDCVKCGLCLKKCPSLNAHITNEEQPRVFSAWSRDYETRITSTSGGIFWEFASKFIDEGGVVVGCRYCSDWKSAEHIIARNRKELYEIKGSKYFQSDTTGIYKQVKVYLSKGVNVLFCGTPCQIAAIKSYIGGEHKNLYCMDFICRSINSPKAFKAYIDELEKEYSAKVIEVHLKNKQKGWQSLASQVKFSNGKECIRDKNEDWWVKGFINNDLYTRESCYHCQYKVLPRINSDITIGDFWGIKHQQPEDLFNGISVIIVNTQKGECLFDKCKDKIEFAVHNLDEVIPENPALLKNPVKTNKQNKFFQLLQKHEFSYCVKKCAKDSLMKKCRRKIYGIGRKMKKLVRVLFKSDIDVCKYVYYNYFCKNVVRKSDAKIIPHRNAILNLQGNSRIILSGNKNLEVGINKLKGSKSETHIRLNDRAIWNCNNGADLFYNTVLEIKSNAEFNTGYFSANGGSVIIAHKEINLGEDVMIGRNVIIYDSDFHTLYSEKGIASNPPKTVNIEDHVWLTSNIIVQKGVTIGKGSLVTAYTTVNKDVPPHSILAGSSIGKVIKEQVLWGRETCPLE